MIVTKDEILVRGDLDHLKMIDKLFTVNIHPTGWSGVTQFTIPNITVDDIKEDDFFYEVVDKKHKIVQIDLWDKTGDISFPMFINCQSNHYTIYKRYSWQLASILRSEAERMQDAIDTYKSVLVENLTYTEFNNEEE